MNSIVWDDFKHHRVKIEWTDQKCIGDHVKYSEAVDVDFISNTLKAK